MFSVCVFDSSDILLGSEGVVQSLLTPPEEMSRSGVPSSGIRSPWGCSRPVSTVRSDAVEDWVGCVRRNTAEAT